jgi:hypothetical protein
MATRLYLPNFPPPPVSPAFDAAWDVTTAADRVKSRKVKLVPDVAASKVSGAETSTSPVNVLNRQYVSDPLSGDQTISGTVTGILRAGESNGAADMRAQTVIRIVSNDGSTVRGTLWAADTSAFTSEFPTTASAVTRKFPLAALTPWTLTPVNALNGDRIVIEVGARAHNVVATSYTHNLYFGDYAPTDLTGAEDQNSAAAPWFEFSQTIAFDTAALVGGINAQVLTKAVGKARVGGIGAQALTKTVGKAKLGAIRAQILTKGRTGVRESSFETFALALSPLAYYKLDETSGTTFDNAEGTAARDGVAYGTPTLGDAGLSANNPSGKSVGVSGGTSGIDLPSLADWTLQQMTLVAAIKTTNAATTDQFILGKDNNSGAGRQWQFKVSGSGHQLTANMLASGTVIVSGAGGPALNDGLPHLVMLTYDGYELHGLVDGVSVFGDTNPAGTLISTATTGIAIGARAPTQHNLPFIGDIDDVLIYPRALPFSDAVALYESWASAPYVPPVVGTFDGWGIAI